MSKEKLGFSVACYRGDIPLLRGCLASIRHFAPDAPICLIADGDFSTKEFEKVYGVQVIRRADVKNPDLRKWSFGFGITKMVAFWESPFDVVFHVDADAVLWGDVRKNLPSGEWDVVHNEPHEEITDFIQNTQYFDPARIFEYIPEFDWKGNPYFQAGIAVVRKNSLDLDEYIRMLELQRKHPDVFINGDQGIFNILVFRALKAGLIRVEQAHLQAVVPNLTFQELARRFRFESGVPVVDGVPTIIHWAGPKPWSGNRTMFREPMDHFRILGAKHSAVLSSFPGDRSLVADEWHHRTVPRKVAGLKSVVKRVIGRE